MPKPSSSSANTKLKLDVNNSLASPFDLMASSESPSIKGLDTWLSQENRMPEVDIWVTPNRSVKMRLPSGDPPRYVLSKIFQVKPGEYVMRPIELTAKMKMRKNICHLLGLEMSDEGLQRLIRAEFVKVDRPTPQCVVLHLDSLFNHLKETQSPGFWNRERRLRFLRAIKCPAQDLPDDEDEVDLPAESVAELMEA
jgi:hypothetical protein